jgi:hypothetical protein
MAGLVPEIGPEIFESLNTITLAMDAAHGDRFGTSQVSSMKLQLLLRNYTPFDTPKLVSMIEKLMLSALRCGTIMEERDVKSLMENNAANARRHRALASQHIDAAIKSIILEKYGKFPKSITPNAISNNIKSDVSRKLKEKNILDRELGVSAIRKRVQKLSALDG